MVGGRADATEVRLTVCDEGIGIASAEQQKIFEHFYRVDNASTRKTQGAGLGLFLVRSIARQHGGDAFAESAGEGRGSTIHLQLPRILTSGDPVEGRATV